MSGYDVAGSKASFQSSCHAAQQKIPGVMAETVVNQFEVVQIEKQNGAIPKGLWVKMKHATKLLFKQQTVGKSCQDVSNLAFGYVSKRTGQPTRYARCVKLNNTAS